MTDKESELTEKSVPSGRRIVPVRARKAKSLEQVEAQLGLAPIAGAAATSRQFIKPALGELGLTESFAAIMAQVARVEAGDLSGQRAMLVAQSVTLNAIFNEMARRTAANMSSHLDAAERYMRMALKAQAQSRANIEALDRLVNGHEQTVRHVHVDNRGGQAIIAEEITTTGGRENDNSAEQPYAKGTFRAALPSANPLGNGVPVPRRERKRAMPDARRD